MPRRLRTSREGCTRTKKRGKERERASEEALSARVDKEAPSMQIKCCFHNHSSVPLSEVRFARFFVIKVKGTFTRGRSCSLARSPDQPSNQPTQSTHYQTTTQLPSLHFNNRKHESLSLSLSFSRERLYMLLIKRTSPTFSPCLPSPSPCVFPPSCDRLSLLCTPSPLRNKRLLLAPRISPQFPSLSSSRTMKLDDWMVRDGDCRCIK